MRKRRRKKTDRVNETVVAFMAAVGYIVLSIWGIFLGFKFFGL